MSELIRVAVSACLLGERVRYDGTHRAHPAVAELSRRFELVRLCPEVEIGLGVPRAPIRLLPTGQVVDSATGTDVTGALKTLAASRSHQLVAGRVCGVVLKHKSPSCGLSGVKVFLRSGDDEPTGALGRGVFAAELLGRMEGLPAAQDCDLEGAEAIEAFARRVQAYRSSLDRASCP